MRFAIGLTVLSVVFMTHAYNSTASIDSVANLVSKISAGNFTEAVWTTLQLHRENQYHLIQEAVDVLFQNSERNFFKYAYRLRQGGGYTIASQVFPSEVQNILDGQLVTLKNRQDGRALKLGRNVDSDGDRKAYGDDKDSVSLSVAWMVTFMWENNDLYFYILGIDLNQHLKLAHSAEDNGDHIAYGDNTLTDDRYKWYLVPARFQGVNLFYIVNKQFDQALKLGDAVDNAGDRIAYGHNGYYHGNPEQLGWYIARY